MSLCIRVGTRWITLTPRQHYLFWRQVSGRDGDGCWTWQGRLDRDGYGVFKIGRVAIVGAHRVAYQLRVGSILRTRELDHSDRADCLLPQPSVRQPGAPRRGDAPRERPAQCNGRLDVCANGHDLLDDDNLYIGPRGQWRCRPCHRAAAQRYRDRQREGVSRSLAS